MRSPELVISTEPPPDDVQYLEDRLYEFNSAETGITDGEWLAIFVRDEDHRIVAGICGNTCGGCAEIRQFWVEEGRRKQGLGTRLLGAAEREARRRGCRQTCTASLSLTLPPGPIRWVIERTVSVACGAARLGVLNVSRVISLNFQTLPVVWPTPVPPRNKVSEE
jgi:GNAT superfamily N-acetyltransferase